MKKITNLFHTQTKHDKQIPLKNILFKTERITKFKKARGSGYQRVHFFFFKRDMLSCTMKMHCRIQNCIH